MEPNIKIEEIIGKYLKQEVSAEEETYLQEWLQADASHQQEYEEMAKIWRASEGVLLQHQFNTSNAWTSINARITALPSATRVRTFKLLPWTKMAVAAAIIGLIATGVWRYYRVTTAGSMQHITARYNNQQVKLPDGSVVFLRKNAVLNYPRSFSEKERIVRLEGDAFFDVTTNAKAPFRINAFHSIVEVLGTSFMISTTSGADKIWVASGKIMFTEEDKAGNHLILSAGQKAVFTDGQFTQGGVKDSNYLAWQNGVLNFNNTPLQQVIETLNDYYNASVILSPEIAAKADHIMVTARFDNQDLPYVLEEIKLTTGLELKRDAQKNFMLYELQPAAGK